MSLSFVSLLAEPVQGGYESLCDRLAKWGWPLRYLDASGDWIQASRELQHGRVQVAAVCGLYYTLLRARGVDLVPVAAPLLDHPRYRSQPRYWADVVVPVGSDVDRWEELKGKTWLFNEKGSFSGYRAFLAELGRRGEGRDFLGEAVETGSHQASVEALLEGKGDFTVLDSTVLDLGPEQVRENVRVVASLGPYPSPLLVARPHLVPQLRSALSQLQPWPEPFAGFEPVRDEDYDPARQAWNASIALLDSAEQVFLSAEGCERSFTAAARRWEDQAILGRVGARLKELVESLPPDVAPGRVHRFDHQVDGLDQPCYLVESAGLQEENLSIVGFLSAMKPGVDLKALFEADERLMQEIHNYEGFLSYSPTEYEPGKWANLAVFRDVECRDRWSSNSVHMKAVRELSADSYLSIRLHLGVWPSLGEPQEWLASRYLDFSSDGVWRGVFTPPPHSFQVLSR